MVPKKLTQFDTRLKFTLLTFLLGLNFFVSYSQVDREFWFAIPKETDGHSTLSATQNVSFKIAAMTLDAHVTISMPQNPAFGIRTFTVLAGQSHIEVLATSYAEFAQIYNNNAPLGSSSVTGKTNRGILIQSDNDITVYYDYDNLQNRDLFSLKGRNALGTEFYTPFQNIWFASTYTPGQMATIEIVATEDNTVVEVFPTIKFQGRPDASTFSVTLNRGEAYSLASRGNDPRPAGTYIRSNKKIAVVINDDSASGANDGCKDIIGDQLVPVDIIGTKYLVMTGDRVDNGSPPEEERGEQIFVTATQPNTTITFKNRNGVLLKSTVLNAGQSYYYSVDISDPDKSSIYVECADDSKKFYVLHTTGIGCELGGAILPPITNCTGSNEVTFYRSGSVADITVNIMIPYDNTKAFNDPTQSHNFFTIYYEDGTTYTIPGSWFEPNIAAGWAVLKMANRNFNAYARSGQANKIVNTKDFFHLGITNGTSGSTNKYGYFSSFNVAQAEVRVASTETKEYIGCYGQTITLVARGGLEYTWHYGSPSGPPTYISDPKSPTPNIVGAPTGSHNYYVEIRQSKCFGIDTTKVSVTILPRTTALFETDRTAICAVGSINFQNQSQEAQYFYWKKQVDNYPAQKFIPSNDMNFSEVLDNKSTSPVRIRYSLTAEHIQGCNDTISKVITVYPRINADFTPSVLEGCNPLTVDFTDKSGGNLSLYTWDFGDQGSSDLASPQHTFKNPGTKDTVYNVKLTVKSPYFCTDDTLRNIRVFPFIKAGFTVDTVKGCSPLTVHLSNNSLNRAAISEYIWDFGDGTIRTSASDTLVHTYPANTSAVPVNYKLLLTVRHPYDATCGDTISRTITVYPQSSLSFITVPGSNTVCDSAIVTFNTTASDAVSSYIWDFGDGSTASVQNPSHLFTNPGTADKVYRVKVTGISQEYCNGYAFKDITVHAYLDPQFSVDLPSSCAPFNANIRNKSRGGVTAYQWEYGDGTHDHHSVTDTIHRFRNSTNTALSSLIKLVVTNSGGCKDSIMQSIKVYPEIKADFVPSIKFGCNPLVVSLSNKSTYLDSVSRFYKWNFGDNTSSTLKNPDHTFTNTTSSTVKYPVKLTVTSTYNCSDDTIQYITVYPYVEANISVDTVKGCSPFPVAVHNSSRGDISGYLWEFEPGSTGTNSAADFSYTYRNTSTLPSNRYLKFIASNADGCTSRDSVLITVYPEVNAVFTSDVSEGCNPLKVVFTDQSGPGTGSGLVPAEYNWVFGDGGTAVTKNTSHIFENLTSSVKTYHSKLIAYSIFKCTDTAQMDIRVYPYVEADFSFDKSTGCSPHTISITNSSSAGSNGFQWIFGDGQQSGVSASVFNHIYRNQGSNPLTFYPKLIASYNGQCQDTIVQSLQVYPEVIAAFREDTLRGCHPMEITFLNQSQNAQRYLWNFGDKGTSIMADPKHTYTNFSNVDSVYNLSLTASSIFNCKSTISKKVTIHAKPKALLDVENSVNCPPYSLPITNLSEAGDFYYWSFGDGDSVLTTNLSPITHVFDNPASSTVTYDLKLYVKSVNNCEDQISQSINIYPRVIADFTPDTSGCSPLLVPMMNHSLRAVTYKWDFGDQITSALKSPSHKFFNNSMNDTTFHVRMIGFSEFGCSDTAFRQVLIHPQPMTEFSALPSYLYYPDARVNIDNQTNAGHWNYSWDFDDGQTSADPEPGVHEYLTWGNFNIRLNVRSDYCSDSVSHRVRVFAPKTIADFDASDNGCVPLTVNFTNHSTWATSYKWEFDDGSPVSSEINPTHVFREPGKYQVRLTTYGDGAEDVTYREIEVYPGPEVNMEISPAFVMLPDALVHYYNTSKYGQRYLWSFGDGDTSDVFEPTHTYKELGTYDVSLSVWTEHQCFDSVMLREAVNVDGTGILTFPNAFKPGNDGPGDGRYTYPDTKNTVFHPYHDGVMEYKLEVYDRWGELIFQSNDVNIGWDGYYKGELCKSDVYIWKAKGKFYNGTSFNKAGDVTILK